MPIPSDISDHYWLVGSNVLSVWSSKRAAYVSIDDPDYVTWKARFGVDLTTRIPDEATLQAVFKDLYPAGWPQRKELPKSTVIQRLAGIGKLDVVWTALNSDPTLFALWFSPDWPNVYVDDAQVLALFHTVGLTDPEITDVLAP